MESSLVSLLCVLKTTGAPSRVCAMCYWYARPSSYSPSLRLVSGLELER